uniref:Uncharacterized protein n=1 Tax=viral metagenome TaxID=1070528 RepID=A0A6H1Z9W7_9ZZZZ
MTDKDHIEIATLRAAGETTRQIEAKTGWSHGSVVKSINQDRNKELITRIQNSFFNDNLERAALNFKAWIHSSPEDRQDKYLKYKASERVLDSAGILGGSSPSILIQQIINQDNRQLVAPIMADILSQVSGHRLPDPADQAIDVHSIDSRTDAANACSPSVQVVNDSAQVVTLGPEEPDITPNGDA